MKSGWGDMADLSFLALLGRGRGGGVHGDDHEQMYGSGQTTECCTGSEAKTFTCSCVQVLTMVPEYVNGPQPGMKGLNSSRGGFNRSKRECILVQLRMQGICVLCVYACVRVCVCAQQRVSIISREYVSVFTLSLSKHADQQRVTHVPG